MEKSREIYLILENIRSAENVGAIFRTADVVGVSKIYLVGITPAPIDRFGRARRDIAKSALGAELTVPWEARASTTAIVGELKKKKFLVIALEQSRNSVDYKKIKPKGNFTLIVGNEVNGVNPATLSQCDKVAEIPMLGQKESLNVSVATGVALYRLLGI
jgi:tRNA G18 (ribose-2'-O)-methylase SpoU